MAYAAAGEIAVDPVSYVAPEHGRLERTVIRGIERATGQRHLKRIYLEFRHETATGASTDDFFTASVKKLRLELRYPEDKVLAAPRAGPLVVVANHPYGVLDGIVICYMLLRLRPDVRILANSALYRAPEVREWVLPIDFAETRQAVETNIRSRAEARRFVKAGGALIVFPSGGVSTTPTPFARRAVDAEWKALTAKFVVQAQAPVLPVFFHGQNSRLFQLASHVHMTLRLSLILHEVRRRIGSPVTVSVGEVVPYARLAPLADDRKALTAELRRRVHALETC